MHNSFDVNQVGDSWVAVSHNFPEISASGANYDEAVDALSRAVSYYRDNNTKEFLKRVRARVSQNLECACGHPLNPEDKIVGIAG